MPGKVTLTITTGPEAGMSLVYEQYNTLLLGRRKDCQICLPEDIFISRHHLLLEINPPEIRLRDLGSLHGTFINGQKYGGRQKHESPAEGSRHALTQVDLHDGDKVKTGQTTFLVRVEHVPASSATRFCLLCEDPITDMSDAGEQAHLCVNCRSRGSPEAIKIILASRSLTRNSLPLPDYTDVEELSKGPLGLVYLARRVNDGQQVVIKALPARVAVNEQTRQRFLREMDATRALRHRHIITCLDSGSLHGLFYFVLEYCEGGDTSALMKSRGGTLSLEEARPILLQTLKALAFAHRQGFVHRDLKPQNILLRGKAGQWSTRLADLGLAKNFEQAGLNGLTLTNEQFGTPFFMPHEQMKHFTPASDVWAMGATCYYILTGTFPRNHGDARDQMKVILEDEAIPIRDRDPHIPQPIARVIDRALAYDESTRYQHAAEMHIALKNAWC